MSFKDHRGWGRGVKNSINKLNGNSGGPREGLRWGVGGGEVGDPGSQRHLAFSHQSGELCKRRRTLLAPMTVSTAHQLFSTPRGQYLLGLRLPPYCLSPTPNRQRRKRRFLRAQQVLCTSLLFDPKSQSPCGMRHSSSL